MKKPMAFGRMGLGEFIGSDVSDVFLKVRLEIEQSTCGKPEELTLGVSSTLLES